MAPLYVREVVSLTRFATMGAPNGPVNNQATTQSGQVQKLLSSRIWSPDCRQVVTAKQVRQHSSIDFVGPHLSLGNGTWFV